MNSKNSINRLKRKNLLQIIISGVLFLCALLAQVYWMINKSNEYFTMLGFVILLIIQGYFLIDGIRNENIRNIEVINQKYEELLRAQKASYIMSKNSYENLIQKVDQIIGEKDKPLSEIVEKQKSIAKVTINHNRKSMEELIKLNIQVLEELDKVSKKVELNVDHKEKPLLDTEEPPAEVKLYDDPNTSLTPEEIEALFLAMGQ